jgi:isopentenyldiphosphate isomerase
MEIFDIIDENGNPTGKTVERSIAHAEGIRHRTAHIWIIRRKNGRTEILLQKRSRNKDSFPGKFDTSSAGHIQAGDEPLESALRELKEELGIHAVPEDLQFAGKFPISFAKEFHGKMFRDEEIAFVYIYREPVNTAELVLQTEEVEEVQWFDLEEVYEQCGKHREIFCVPALGLGVVRRYLKSIEKN